MKRLTALTLALVLALSLCASALASESVTPTAPEWINAEDYLTFPGDEVYLPENWAKVEALREEARNGGLLPKDRENPTGSVGTRYETALVWLKYALNAGPETEEVRKAFRSVAFAFDVVQSRLGKTLDETYYRLELEGLRARAIRTADFFYDWKDAAGETLSALNMTAEDFFDGQYMYLVKPEEKAAIIADMERIDLLLNGTKLELDVPAQVRNQRTMVPIRAVGEAIGADVEWVQDKQQVVMTRAGSTVTMTLNSTTAYIDGKAEEMDVAPYAVDGRTLLPARYVAEFFGQKVDWDGKKRQVLITQDKSAAGDSNLEQWALAMGLTYAYQYYDYDKNFWETNSPQFGMYPRTADEVQSSREGLERNWGGSSREHIISIVEQMTAHGHNESFLAAAADVKLRTPEERAAISALSGVWGEHMWTFTEELDKKWGDKGILAWDLSRMGAMVQWGYHAGRLTYEEALALVEPAARLAAENFSSWEEFYENYLDGYNWWARNNVVGMDPWETERGPLCREMLKNPVLDDALFQTGVIPLPDGT